MKHNHDISLDGKQHPVPMGFAAIEELAYLKRKLCVFRCERAAVGKLGKRGYRFAQSLEPTQAWFACSLLN
jgi:hypothetical protein